MKYVQTIRSRLAANYGEVTLEIRNELPKIRDGRVSLVFSIRDTGIGIPADKLDAVFDKFTQQILRRRADMGEQAWDCLYRVDSFN